jgi:hypothetical protein
MLVQGRLEALVIGGPYPALVFSGLFTLRRRRRKTEQVISANLRLGLPFQFR